MLIAARSEMHLADEITVGPPWALRYDDVVMHVPLEVAEWARAAAKANGIDALVSVGGGSTTGQAKAIVLTSGRPVRSLAEGLPRVVNDPLDPRRPRARPVHGVPVNRGVRPGSGLHHKICRVLGGKHNLPPAQTHATVLPYVLALNAPAVPGAERRIAGVLGSGTALGGLTALKAELSAPHAECRLSDAAIAPLGKHAQRVHLAPRALAQRYVERACAWMSIRSSGSQRAWPAGGPGSREPARTCGR